MGGWRSLLVMAAVGLVIFFSAAILPAQQIERLSDGASAVSVSAQWRGAWRRIDGGKGTVIATITQSASTVTGTVTVKSTPCGDLVVPINGLVSGTVVDIKGRFTCEGRRQQIRFQGYEHQNVFIGGGFFVYQDGQVDDGGTFYMNKQ